ncbi:thiamine pyrophosphate-dependent enzyme [Rhizohabitans arisaemae]|uniref:thiamine pyrophosphate-dependent enzyme n=1 Tax=Rhizohabitans arisaemae TaxID=2720610 RepID=UPI0024B04F63|nr:thiamine pyrophosphate-dependent enzyme [Rhizohabitans arisaemae]
MEMTGGEALARQLVNEGVTRLFGVPGVQLDFAVDGLAKVADQLTFHNTRHEQAASYMADGYARTTGDAGVCMVVPGPGLLNAMAGLSTAYACSSPVLCIAGQIPSSMIGRGLGMLHEVRDQTTTFGTVTKWTGSAMRAEDVPRLVHEAFQVLRSGRPQPVGIEIPPDVLSAVADVDLIGTSAVGTPAVPDPALIAKAGALLRGAARPVLYAGGGVLAGGAWAELAELAEALGAPVVMSQNGRGAVDERHPLALTSLGGREVLPEADVVLAVGTRFLMTIGRPVGTSGKLIMLNADAGDLGAPRVAELDILGDARLGLAALRAELPEATREPWARLDGIRDDCRKQIAEIEPQASYVRALRAALPEDGILVNELTQVGYLSQIAFPVYGPRTYVWPGYQGTLGYGFATALGAKAASPDRPVLCVTGDGGFGWNMQELATARKYGIGLVTVVFDDGAFGNVKRTQKQRFEGRVHGTELSNPDFVKLAEAFGVTGVRAETPQALEGVVRESLAAGEPALVHAPVGEMDGAWHLIHDFLAGPRR